MYPLVEASTQIEENDKHCKQPGADANKQKVPIARYQTFTKVHIGQCTYDPGNQCGELKKKNYQNKI